MRKPMKIIAILCMAAGGFAMAPAQAESYWRLDVGWSEANDADFKDNDFFEAGNILADPSFTEAGILDKIEGSTIVGGGVGYRLTGGLRGDVTLVHRGSYSLKDRTFEADYYANIRSMALMANGYYDFTAGDVRPYIGAGIGQARNETETLTQDFRLGFANTFSGATKTETAVALTAGVGIPYPDWILDIGYRYIDLGKFGTGTTAALGITSGHTGELTAHELTVGGRF